MFRLGLVEGNIIMGNELFDEEAVKVERFIVLFVVAAVIVHVFSTYTNINFDTTAFAVFAAMCFSGYFALQSAKEIVASIEERKQAAYETLKANSLAITVNPVSFSNNSKFSKYATSTNTKKYQMI